MMVQKIIVIGIILFQSIGAMAHNPNVSSTMLIEQSDNTWVVQIRAALTAFEYEVHHHYGKESYKTPVEFEALVLKHVEENMSIQFDENLPVTLQNGSVKLGHETSVSFDIIGKSEELQSLIISNSSFRDIVKNQSALMIVKKGFSKDQFILNHKNEHTAKLKVGASKFELLTPFKESKTKSLLLVFGVSMFITIFYFGFKKHKSTEHSLSLTYMA